MNDKVDCILFDYSEIDNRDIDDIVEDAQEYCCYGFFLTDDDLWYEDKAKKKLAEYFGCKADEMELIVIENSYSVIHHNYKIA